MFLSWIILVQAGIFLLRFHFVLLRGVIVIYFSLPQKYCTNFSLEEYTILQITKFIGLPVVFSLNSSRQTESINSMSLCPVFPSSEQETNTAKSVINQQEREQAIFSSVKLNIMFSVLTPPFSPARGRDGVFLVNTVIRRNEIKSFFPFICKWF